MSQTAFAVPKDKQKVSVQLNGGRMLEGTVFLEYGQGGQSIHHRMMSFLHDGNAFFPLSLTKGGATEFIHKKNINLVEIGFRETQEDIGATFSLMQSIAVSAVFADGSTILGALMAEVPAEKARLSDILNLADAFLSLKQDHRICYVNKHALQKVVYAQKS